MVVIVIVDDVADVLVRRRRQQRRRRCGGGANGSGRGRGIHVIGIVDDVIVDERLLACLQTEVKISKGGN